MRLRLRNSLLLACASLSACAVGPDYHTPDMKLPKHFAAAPAKQAPSGVDAAEWWKSLGDKELDSLIDRAVKANTQAGIALLRLEEAREEEAVVIGGALPEAEASLGAARGTGSDLARSRASGPLVSAENTSGFRHVSQISGFDAVWELDLFGQYRREIEAAGADTEAAAAARNEVLITLIADLVRAYADLRSLQMQQAVLAQNIGIAKKYVNVTQERYQRGITNGLDASLAERQLQTLEAEAAPLSAQTSAAEYTIAVLTGEFPEAMTQELSVPGNIPALPAKLNTGVPLTLLKNRPDIRRAERELAAATARVGVATADLFPHVALIGSAGRQGQGLGFSPSSAGFIWSAGPGISWALLDFGALDALVKISDMRAQEMLLAYKQNILNAVKDVDTAFSAYAAEQSRLRSLEAALVAGRRAVSLANQRYDRGLTDMLNVIDAERQEFELEREYVLARQQAAEQFVALYKALGSGWERYQSIPPAPTPLPAVIAAVKSLIVPSLPGPNAEKTP